MTDHPPNPRLVMGLFTDDGVAAETIEALRGGPWRLHRVHGPYPSHRVMDALRMKTSPLGWFTLAGGITGFITGYALAIYSTLQWNLIVSGKPVISPLPYFVVGYELTILFGILSTVLGLLILARLPEFKSLKECYDPRCSGEYFGVVAACDPGAEAGLADFFTRRGGETRIFSTEDA